MCFTEKYLLRILVTIAVFIILMICPVSSYPFGNKKEAHRIKIGVLPLVNLSGSFLAEEKVGNVLRLELLKSGRYNLADPGKVEKFLEKERLRCLDMVSTSLARKLKEELGIEGLIIGRVEQYESGENPEVGINLVMIDLTTTDIFWSSSLAYTGEDFKGFFGFGKVSTAQELSRIIIRRMVASIPEFSTRMSFNEAVPY